MRQTRLVAYVSSVHALVHTMEWTYAALLSRIGDEFGPGLFGLGAVATVFAIAFGSSALPAGVLVDRLGSQRVLFFAFSAGAVAALLVATSPNVVVLAVFLALLGLTIGLYHPAGISLIAQAADQRGASLGYHGLAGNLGIAVAPVLAIGVAEAIGSWRWSYVLLALLALLAAVSLRLVRLPQTGASSAGALGGMEPAYEGATARHGPAPAASRSTARPAPASLLPLVLVYGVFVLNGFIYRGSLTFLPVHFERTLDVSWFGIDEDNLKPALTTAALLVGAFGQILGGYLSERHQLERLAPLLTLALIPFLLLMGLSGGVLLVAATAAFVFFNFSSQPVYTGLIADYSPQRALGRSYGVSFFAAFGIGSLGATVAGFFADRWGTDAAFQSLSGFAVLTLVLAVCIWRLAGRPVPAGAAEPGWPARPPSAVRRS